MILLFKGVLKMSTEHLDKKECKKYYQIYSDNSNTPSLIRTIPSVLEFHQTPRFRARGLSPPIGISPCPEDITVIQLFTGLYHRGGQKSISVKLLYRIGVDR